MHTSSLRRMRSHRRGGVLALPAVVAVGALALAACGGQSAARPAGSPLHSGTSSSPSAAPAPAASGPALTVRTTSLGTILADGRGFTLYAFEADQGTTSACSGACAAVWPAVTSPSASPHVGAGVTPSLVGHATQADGTNQLTYAGHPRVRECNAGGARIVRASKVDRVGSGRSAGVGLLIDGPGLAHRPL